ncbi:MAG: leucine-rich repeat domain-containing protein [Promethearchaeota archaeon]
MDNLDRIGKEQVIVLLKEWINNSNDIILRLESLECLGSVDFNLEDNFEFFEQLFVSDEYSDVRILSGKILQKCYSNHEKFLELLDYALTKISDARQKLFALDALFQMNKKEARKILEKCMKNLIETRLKGDERALPSDFMDSLKAQDCMPPLIPEICLNMVLEKYYSNECGYVVSLREGKIVLLNCEGAGLSSIKEIVGLERLIYLEHLLLPRNKIKIIDGLTNLENLKVLNISKNNINKIGNLNILKCLEELDLSHNKIKTIENLYNLRKLKTLNLEYNEIEQIQGLESNIALETLNLNHNKIVDIKNVNTLRNLKNLSLSSNNIKRIASLLALYGLTWLYLNDNCISQISGLTKLDRLKGLYLSNNLIKKIAGLEDLVNLTKLQLSNNQIEKIEGLEQLQKLQELYLDDNQIKELEGLEGLNSLVILFLKNNLITDYKNVNGLQNLNFLFLNDNPLTVEGKKKYFKRFKF